MVAAPERAPPPPFTGIPGNIRSTTGESQATPGGIWIRHDQTPNNPRTTREHRSPTPTHSIPQSTGNTAPWLYRPPGLRPRAFGPPSSLRPTPQSALKKLLDIRHGLWDNRPMDSPISPNQPEQPMSIITKGQLKWAVMEMNRATNSPVKPYTTKAGKTHVNIGGSND